MTDHPTADVRVLRRRGRDQVSEIHVVAGALGPRALIGPSTRLSLFVYRSCHEACDRIQANGLAAQRQHLTLGIQSF